MTTRATYPIQYLLIHDTEKIDPNGNAPKAGAFIFFEDLPCGENVKVKNVISLTRKQILHLARINGIGATTDPMRAMKQFASLVGNMRSKAVVSSEPHKKGDSYVDQDGAKQIYNENSVRNTIDSVILPQSLVDKFDAVNVENIIGSWDKVDPFADLPVTDGAVKTELTTVN